MRTERDGMKVKGILILANGFARSKYSMCCSTCVQLGAHLQSSDCSKKIAKDGPIFKATCIFLFAFKYAEFSFNAYSQPCSNFLQCGLWHCPANTL